MKEINRSNIFSYVVCAFIVFVLVLTSAFYAHNFDFKEGRKILIKNATNDGGLVIGLSQGFVRAYSDFEAKYVSGMLPNPAIYRSHALKLADLDKMFGGALRSEVVGFPGKAISREPIDDEMHIQMQSLRGQANPELSSITLIKGDETIHRSVWPFYAKDATCINCHNAIKGFKGAEQWKVGDLMGAQFVEKNIQPDLIKLKQHSLVIASLVGLAVLAVCCCFLFIFRQLFLTKKLKVMATTDAMTGCINRREMFDRVEKLSGQVTGAILMLDIDKFKGINDSHGHAAGDIVIQVFSETIRFSLRKQDWVARVGGEEFIVWLTDVTKEEALISAERLRTKIELSPVVFEDKNIEYSVSVGLHVFKNESPSGFNKWVSRADKRLYKAKNSGRNKVVC